MAKKMYDGIAEPLRPDRRIDASGNYKPSKGDRKLPGGSFGRNLRVEDDEVASRRGSGPVTDARTASFGGGAMYRPVNKPGIKRYDSR
jgi:hypothetical protein